MKVAAVREHAEQHDESVDRVISTAQLDHELPNADFVVLAAPLTPTTRHIMDAVRIAKMKRTAYIVNVSRGPLIDDEALITALRENRIAGAGLDVFAEEPLPPDSPYWDLPNVIVTPHTAAVTPKLWERHYMLISDNLRRYLAGDPLRNVVNKRLGY
jgi:phosphoglycerate dehydrogenase-like enzyme